jgi:prophage DNA circulation protein
MQLIADMLMIAATIGASAYCLVLAARLRRFTTLETGMGGAIAVLSAQVDDMTRALEKARAVATLSERNLEELTTRADALARRLELLMASLHDLPEPAPKPARSEAEAEEEGRRLRFVRRRAGRDHEEYAE